MDTKQNLLNPEELLQAMQVAEENEDWQELLYLGEQLLQLQPNNASVKASLEHAYVQQAHTLEGQGISHEAIALCDRALSLNRHSVDAYIVRAEARYRIAKRLSMEPVEENSRVLADYD